MSLLYAEKLMTVTPKLGPTAYDRETGMGRFLFQDISQMLLTAGQTAAFHLRIAMNVAALVTSEAQSANILLIADHGIIGHESLDGNACW